MKHRVSVVRHVTRQGAVEAGERPLHHCLRRISTYCYERVALERLSATEFESCPWEYELRAGEVRSSTSSGDNVLVCTRSDVR
jgi:hypothetical protein